MVDFQPAVAGLVGRIGGTATIINVSRLEAFAECEQRFDFRYNQAIEPPRGPDDARDFGSAIHAGLASWYSGHGERQAIETYRLALKAELGQDEHELYAYGERLLGRYFDYYAEADRAWEVLAVERPFAYADATSRNTYVGRWDLVVRRKDGIGAGMIHHVQHKTVGSTVGLANYVSKYDLAWHERLYALAMERQWPGSVIGGTVLNCLRKSMRIDPASDFLRYHIPVSSELKQRFLLDAAERVLQIELAEANGHWLQTPNACMTYNRICSYHLLCKGIPIDRESAFVARELDYVDEARRLEMMKRVAE